MFLSTAGLDYFIVFGDCGDGEKPPTLQINFKYQFHFRDFGVRTTSGLFEEALILFS